MKYKALVVMLMICLTSSRLKSLRTKGGYKIFNTNIPGIKIEGYILCTDDSLAGLNASMQEIQIMISQTSMKKQEIHTKTIENLLENQTICLYNLVSGDQIIKTFREISSFTMSNNSWEIRLMENLYEPLISKNTSDSVFIQNSFMLNTIRYYIFWLIYVKARENQSMYQPLLDDFLPLYRNVELLAKNSFSRPELMKMEKMLKYAKLKKMDNMDCMSTIANIELGFLNLLQKVFYKNCEERKELFLLSGRLADSFRESFSMLGWTREIFKKSLSFPNAFETLFDIFVNSKTVEDLQILNFILSFNDIDYSRDLLVSLLTRIGSQKKLKKIIYVIYTLIILKFIPKDKSVETIKTSLKKIDAETFLKYFKDVDFEVVKTLKRYYESTKGNLSALANILKQNEPTTLELLGRFTEHPEVLTGLLDDVDLDIFKLIFDAYKSDMNNFSQYIKNLKNLVLDDVENETIAIALENPFLLQFKEMFSKMLKLRKKFNSKHFLMSLYKGENGGIIDFGDFLLKFERKTIFNGFTLFVTNYDELIKLYYSIKSYFDHLVEMKTHPNFIRILLKYNENDINSIMNAKKKYSRYIPKTVDAQNRLFNFIESLDSDGMKCLYDHIAKVDKSHLKKIQVNLIKFNSPKVTLEEARMLYDQNMKIIVAGYPFMNNIEPNKFEILKTVEIEFNKMLKIAEGRFNNNVEQMSFFESLGDLYNQVNDIYDDIVGLFMTTRG
jgi:hypothetical protein